MLRKARAKTRQTPGNKDLDPSTDTPVPKTIPVNVVCIDTNHTVLGSIFSVVVPLGSEVGGSIMMLDLLKKASMLRKVVFNGIEHDDIVFWKIKSPRLARSFGPNTRFRKSLVDKAEPDLQEYIRELNYKTEVERYCAAPGDMRPQHSTLADHLQIIIEVPVQKKRHRQLVDDDSEPGDIPPAKITALSRRDEFLRTAAERTHSAYPSNTVAINKIYNVIHGGRHTVCHDFPPGLYHSALATLQHDLESLDYEEAAAAAISNDNHGIFDRALSFFRAATLSAESEDGRWSSVRLLFSEIFRNDFRRDTPISMELNSLKPDVVWGKPAYIILELKTEAFVAGNASLQAVRAYLYEYTQVKRKKTVFPAILIGLMGNVLEISAAVTPEHIHFKNLLHFKLEGGISSSGTVQGLVQIALALKKCAETLKAENAHEHESQILGSEEDWNLPHPTIHPSYQHPNPNLTFKCPLSRKNEEVDVKEATPPCSLFLADMSGKEVVVKFTSDHNQDAHKVLAAQHLAPELHGCYPLMGCGKMKMIVMDRVKGVPMSEYDECSLPSSVFNDVEEAVRLLHAENIVFGDLRACNIMVVVENDVKRAMLVDFDWAGEHHEDLYPVLMNSLLIGKEWHVDALPQRRLNMQHDDWALQKIITTYHE